MSMSSEQIEAGIRALMVQIDRNTALEGAVDQPEYAAFKSSIGAGVTGGTGGGTKGGASEEPANPSNPTGPQGSGETPVSGGVGTAETA